MDCGKDLDYPIGVDVESQLDGVTRNRLTYEKTATDLNDLGWSAMFF